MSWKLDLALIKQHVRADDFSEDDAYLAQLAEVATTHVIQGTNRSEEELLQMGGGVLPLPLQQAILLLVGHWYNVREAVGPSNLAEIPFTIDALCKPYRKLK